MHTIAAVALAAAAAFAAAASGGEYCDDAYECKFYYETSDELFNFDLSPLCSSHGYAFPDTANTVLNDTYNFNVCGYSPKRCLPQGSLQAFTTGVAVQSWGEVPQCDTAAPACTDPVTNQPVCCTEQCEILGIETPEFRLKDKSNPATGGLVVLHRAMPYQFGVLNACPTVGLQGVEYGRNVTFHMKCNPGEQLKWVDAEEGPTCSYQIYLESKHACGSAYTGPGSAASRNGLIAGMFFFGLFLGLAAIGGYWYYTVRKAGGKSGGYFKFGSASAAPAPASAAAPSAYTDTKAAMGSSSYSTVGSS